MRKQNVALLMVGAAIVFVSCNAPAFQLGSEVRNPCTGELVGYKKEADMDSENRGIYVETEDIIDQAGNPVDYTPPETCPDDTQQANGDEPAGRTGDSATRSGNGLPTGTTTAVVGGVLAAGVVAGLTQAGGKTGDSPS